MSIDAIGTFEYWIWDEVEHLIANTLPDNHWHREYCNDGYQYDDLFVLNVRKEGNHLHFRDVECVVPPCDYDIFDEFFDENDVKEANLVSLLFKHFKGLGFDKISYHTIRNEYEILSTLKNDGFTVTIEKDKATTLTVSTSQNDHA